MATKLKSGQTILFIGDSITDCGRRSPDAPLGHGYVKFFHDFLRIREPQKQVTVLNKGVSGNRITQIQERWTDDVLRYRPHWLSVKIGINDLHSFRRNVDGAVSPELFETVYDEILARTRKHLPRTRILLIDPFYISRETSKHSFRRTVLDTLPAYLHVVAKMSKKYRTRRIKTHERFQALLKYCEPEEFCPEPVHPNCTGHLVLAEAVYEALSR